MNRFTKLNQNQMLELCNIIKPEGNWAFAQLMNESPIESAEAVDNIYEFTTDDAADIIQFFPHEEDEGIKCYIDHNGDMAEDSIPEEKSAAVEDYLKNLFPDNTSNSENFTDESIENPLEKTEAKKGCLGIILILIICSIIVF